MRRTKAIREAVRAAVIREVIEDLQRAMSQEPPRSAVDPTLVTVAYQWAHLWAAAEASVVKLKLVLEGD